MRLGQQRHDGEVERVEGLAGRQPRLAELALEAAAGAFGQFVLGQGGQQARAGLAFAVGLGGELRPQRLPDDYTDPEVDARSEAVFRHVFRVYPTVPSPYYQTDAA